VWRAADSPNDSWPDAFRTRLRTHRLAAELTQEGLAERAGLSVRAIQNLERGERRPYADTTARLVMALELQGAEREAFELAARKQPRRGAPLAQPEDATPQATTTPNNLPVPLTACIGREVELEAIRGALRDARLVTLVGPGGSGKTRLAQELGLELTAREDDRALASDGVWYVELDAVTDPGLVVQAVASALGVGEQRGQSLAVTVSDALHNRRVVLVLDNCEHVLAGCAELVEALLSSCPGVRVVATSRQPLWLPGEVVRVVPPLELPPSDAPSAALEHFASVRLFIERARAAAPGLVPGPGNVATMANICRQLDGIPLALELAAARLRGLSVNDLAKRLDEPFRLLTAATHRRPRQQSLRAAIDWSYDLLDESQRALLRQLAVFGGGWTLSAAEAVCGASAADGLAMLVDNSLVQVDWRDPLEPRYRLLETVRQYALERLQAGDEANPTRDAHARHYLSVAETADAALDGPDQLFWLKRLDAEQGNLRAALGWALSQPDAEPGQRLATALGLYWDIRGERTEGLAWLEQALRIDASIQPATRIGLLCAAGRLALATRNEQAASWLEESLAASRAQNDQLGAIRALVLLGRLWVDEAVLARASTVLEEAYRLAVAIDDRAGIAAALGARGQAELDRADYAASLTLLERALGLFRTLGDRVGQASTLLQLAMASLELGQAPAAEAQLEEAQSLLRELGDAVGVAWTQHDLARLALDTGRPVQAAELFERSLELFRSLGHGSGAAWSLHNLGRAQLALGDTSAALALFEAGLELFRKLGHDRGTAWALYNLAWLAADRGEHERAWDLLGDGLTRFRTLGLGPGVCASLVLAARLACADDPLRAARWLGIAGRLQPIAAQDRARAEATLRETRDVLAEATFDEAWKAGRALSATEVEAELDSVPINLALVATW
jgi:predicted ATPase/DNA-binding XRE family transcriptional regulator